MTLTQTITIFLFGLSNILILIKGYKETVIKKNPFGQANYLLFFGIFVWGDSLAICLYWLISSTIAYFLKDWFLFLIFISAFWLIRSSGEAVYWLNQQFSSLNRNPPHRLLGYHFVKNDSIWFIYQVTWQCLAALSLISTIYLAHRWLIT